MKSYSTIITLLILGLVLVFEPRLMGQEDKNYGKTPDELFPFSRFQEPYIRHFVYPPQPYLGPNREKPEPQGLKEVRIGFLGPLEGSPIVEYGIQMMQGINLAVEEANQAGGYG